MGGVDPHAVLGVGPAASPDEVTAAYRRLAKRHHPDRTGDDGRAIRDINRAYAMLRDGEVERTPRPRTRRRPETMGAWLPASVRMALGFELLRRLHPGEMVERIAAASTWDAHDVRLVLTDRRVVWLRDDALGDRVRWVARDQIERVEARPARRRRAGELRLHLKEGRRLDFAELRPESLGALSRALQDEATSADTGT